MLRRRALPLQAEQHGRPGAPPRPSTKLAGNLYASMHFFFLRVFREIRITCRYFEDSRDASKAVKSK